MRNNLFILFVFILTLSCHTSKNIEKAEPVSKSIESSSILDKNIKGVDFYAYGNDSVWSLEIDFDKYVKIFCAGMKEEMVIPVENLIEEDEPSATNYEVTNKQGVVHIQIQRNKDASVGDKPYLVNVKVKNDKIERVCEGAGQYYGDIRLHCDWQLEKLDGEDVPASKYGIFPNINIYLDKNKVAGFLGCNNFAADIYFGREEIFFSRIVRTKKACLDYNIEDKLMDVLNQKKFKYKIEGDQLFLTDELHEIILKKAN